MGGAETRVELFTSGPDCSLCERTEVDLGLLAREFALRLRVVDVRGDPALRARYFERVPVVLVDGAIVAEGRIEPAPLRHALERAVGGGDEG